MDRARKIVTIRDLFDLKSPGPYLPRGQSLLSLMEWVEGRVSGAFAIVLHEQKEEEEARRRNGPPSPTDRGRICDDVGLLPQNGLSVSTGNLLNPGKKNVVMLDETQDRIKAIDFVFIAQRAGLRADRVCWLTFAKAFAGDGVAR